ncbi:MAG: tRNA (adenosine(37)-N6)-dimethylallyltransferase MiaA [Halobacteriovorax sp.]|nr:tRNA (adenosine(37)-N6)-dimethylallyltransferase MiaA [Halobacteriovorax sp.]
MSKRPLIIISGATATGKTATSISIAKLLGEHAPRIINFDSLLFYKELNIGTAKPSKEEQAGIEHRLIDIRSINEPLNAADFMAMALDELEACEKENRLPILVGGSGFYLRALVKGMYESINVSDKVKQEAAALYEASGIEPFIKALKQHDPERMKALHENDHYRIRRAWEHFQMTGKPISPVGEQFAGGDPYDFSKHRLESWDFYHIHMQLPRPQHARIIADRTAKMLENGFIEETRQLLADGFSEDSKPLQSIGYREILAYFRGELEREVLAERIEGTTRRLAKQQRTFFAKVRPKFCYHPIDDVAKLQDDVVEWLKKRG